jgi:WD40 repeat protein
MVVSTNALLFMEYNGLQESFMARTARGPLLAIIALHSCSLLAEPLSLVQCRDLLRTKTPEAVVLSLVRERGVAFGPDEWILKVLRDAGGTEALLAAVRSQPIRRFSSSVLVDHQPDDHAGPVRHLKFSADGRRLASCADDGLVLWDVETGRIVFRFSDRNNPIVVAFAPDGSRLAVGDSKFLTVLDAQRGNVVLRQTHSSAQLKLHDLAFSPDGKYLIGGTDTELVVWDESLVDRWRLIAAKNSERPYFLQFPFVFAERRILALFASDHAAPQLISWDARSFQKIGTVTLPELADGVVPKWLSPDGRLVAGEKCDGRKAGNGDAVLVGEAATGRLVGAFPTDCFYGSMAFSPDGRFLIKGLWSPGGGDVPVLVWDLRTGQQQRGDDHPGAVHGLAVSSDSRLLATGHREGIVVWRLPSLAKLMVLGTSKTEFNPSWQVSTSIASFNVSRTGEVLRTDDSVARGSLFSGSRLERLSAISYREIGDEVLFAYRVVDDFPSPAAIGDFFVSRLRQSDLKPIWKTSVLDVVFGTRCELSKPAGISIVVVGDLVYLWNNLHLVALELDSGKARLKYRSTGACILDSDPIIRGSTLMFKLEDPGRLLAISKDAAPAVVPARSQ